MFEPQTDKASEKRATRQSKPAAGVPAQLQKRLEEASGVPLGDVHVHYASQRPAALGALAYARGSQIHLGPGQERLLAHELAHVIQQKQGFVRPTRQLRGVALNDSPALELAADRMARFAAPGLTTQAEQSIGDVVQRRPFTREEIQALLESMQIKVSAAAGGKLLELKAAQSQQFIDYLTQVDTESLLCAIVTDAAIGGFVLGGGGALIDRIPTLDFMSAIAARGGPSPGWTTAILAAIGGLGGAVCGLYHYYTQKPAAAVRFLLQLANQMPLDVAAEHDRKRRTDSVEVYAALSGAQKSSVTKCLLQLRPICGEAGAQKMLENALVYVNEYMLDEEAPAAQQNMTEVFVNRLKNMTRFVQRAYSSLPAAQQQKYYLVSSASDAHKGGQHVLFLVDKENPANRIVYKPRSVAIDAAIVGRDGIFAAANQRLAQQGIDKKLPTMHIAETSDASGQEEYIQKQSVFSPAAAIKYYEQMGMLEAAARLLGLTDLHQDNVMATERGPVILDAECALLFSHSGLADALHKRTSPDGSIAPAAFDIQDGGQQIPANTAFEALGSPYRAAYDAGLVMMTQQIQAFLREQAFVRTLRTKTAGVRVRIVPLPTNLFAQAFRNYHRTGKNIAQTEIFIRGQGGGEPDVMKNVVAMTFDELLKDLGKTQTHVPYFVAPEEITRLSSRRAALEKSVALRLRVAFEQGDVPCFEIRLPALDSMQAFVLQEGETLAEIKMHFAYEAVLQQKQKKD